MKKILKIILFIILINLAIPCFGQDVSVNGRNTNLYFDGISLPWSSLATRNYVLAPIGPDYGFCISVVNNNPTSSHSFSISAFQSGDFNVIDYSHNTGRYASLTVVGTPSPIAANSTGTFFVKSNGASKVAFVFTGGTTQAGNPDTFDIYGVQTTSNGCGTVNPSTGQQYTLSTPNSGTSSTLPIQVASDGLNSSYIATQTTISPTAAAILLNVFATTPTKNIYFDKATVTSTAAILSISFNAYNIAGTGCTGLNANQFSNMKVGTANTSVAVANTACTGAPNGGLLSFVIVVPAGGTVVLDLRGLIIPSGTTAGIDAVAATGVTSNVSVSFQWYER